MRQEGLFVFAMLLALQPASALVEEPRDTENVLVFRYACLLGAREEGAAPAAAGVVSPAGLADFLIDWQPGEDSDEVREVFALKRLDEIFRQASQLPLSGGEVQGVYAFDGSSYETRFRALPRDGEVLDVTLELLRDGRTLMAPSVTVPLGERAILSTQDRPEGFIVVVLEVDRMDARELRRRGVRFTWHKGARLVDGETVTPPKAIEKEPPRYTEAARKARVQGLVTLRLLIDGEGKVRDADVLRGLPHGLSEAAIEAVRSWRFQPALFEGKPTDVIYNITINYRLEPGKDEGKEG